MRIIAIAILLCLVACAQQNSDAEQNISSQPETPESKASQRKASSTGQEAALDESIRRILERNLPEVPEQEREKVYREEALTGHPTARGVQIMKEIALYSARHQPPSGYGPEYDRLKKEARVSYTNKAIEASITNAGIQDQKIFENEVERTGYIENLTRQREIEYQRSVGRALTNYEKDIVRSFTESQARRSEEDLKKHQEEVAQSAAPHVLPYTDAAGRAEYVKKKLEEHIEKYQTVMKTRGQPLDPDHEKLFLLEAEAQVQMEEARARK